jgi:hypothetical protein
MVSRFPRGICSTRLIELGTARTILDPLSTLRVSQSAGTSLSVPSACSKTFGRDAMGANNTSCVLVVKITNADATVKEVVFVDKIRVSSSDRDAYSFPDLARPTKMTCSPDASPVDEATSL